MPCIKDCASRYLCWKGLFSTLRRVLFRGRHPSNCTMCWILCAFVFCSVCSLIEGRLWSARGSILLTWQPQPGTGLLQKQGLGECCLKEGGVRSALEVDLPGSPLVALLTVALWAKRNLSKLGVAWIVNSCWMPYLVPGENSCLCVSLGLDI